MERAGAPRGDRFPGFKRCDPSSLAHGILEDALRSRHYPYRGRSVNQIVTKPITMDYTTLPALFPSVMYKSADSFVVFEKSDGERVLIYSLGAKRGEIWMIRTLRDECFVHTDLSEEKLKQFCSEHDASGNRVYKIPDVNGILDTEVLVGKRNPGDERDSVIFRVFDAIVLRPWENKMSLGKDGADQLNNLVQRLYHVGVMLGVHSYEQKLVSFCLTDSCSKLLCGGAEPEENSIYIEIKRPYNVNKLDALDKFVNEFRQEGTVYGDNDGYVFTKLLCDPHGTRQYVSGVSETQVKWKRVEEQTVDLLYQTSSDEIDKCMLSVSTRSGIRGVYVGSTHDVSPGHGLEPGTIYSFKPARTGDRTWGWKVVYDKSKHPLARPDKIQPNFITSFENIQRAIAVPITLKYIKTLSEKGSTAINLEDYEQSRKISETE